MKNTLIQSIKSACLPITACAVLTFAGPSTAQDAGTVAAKPPPAPPAPAVLPGKGLAQYDFFYPGEAKQDTLCYKKAVDYQSL